MYRINLFFVIYLWIEHVQDSNDYKFFYLNLGYHSKLLIHILKMFLIIYNQIDCHKSLFNDMNYLLKSIKVHSLLYFY